MNFLYIDKVNTFSEIRIAERTIWGEEIPQMGHKVFYLLKGIKRKNLCTQEVSEKIFYIQLKKIRGLSTFIFIYKLSSLVISKKIDFVVVRNAVDLALYTFFISRILKRKMIYIKAFPSVEQMISKQVDNKKFSYYTKFLKLVLKIEIFIIKKSEFIITRTEKYSEFLTNEYAVDREMLAIPMGIKTFHNNHDIPYKDIRLLNSKDKDLLITIYFGTLNHERKIEFIINVIERINKNNNKIRCYIIGGPEDRLNELQELVNTKKMNDSFVFLKALPRYELFGYIKSSDFSLSPIPPINEYIISSPTKVLESIALGCPVIGNEEIYDQKEIIEESGGGYILPYSESAFADKIINLYNEKSELKEKGLKGSRYVISNRNYKKLAEDILNYLRLDS